MKNDKAPDVSVVIPCHNSAKFLEAAVRSACHQTGVEVEVIVVDDGSTDGTSRLLAKLKKEFSQLRVKTLPANKGQSSAKNLGFKLAKGAFVVVLDSDDYYVSDKALSVALSSATPGITDVIICGFLKKIPLLPAVPIIPTGLAIEQLLNVMNWQLIIRNDFLRHHQLEFSDQTPQREDFPFVLDVLLASRERALSASPLLVHVLRPGSVMRSKADSTQLTYFTRHIQHVTRALTNCNPTELGDVPGILAKKYLRKTFVYWNRPLQECLKETEDAPQIEVVRNYLRALTAVTRAARSFSSGTGNEAVDMSNVGAYHGTFDVLRLVAESEDLDSLRLLLSGSKLHYSRLLELAEKSSFSWAKTAITTYIRFSQSATYPEEPPTKETISSLVKRIVLHIGYPKTGSSAIQRWMEDNRFDLLKLGVWYPIYGVKRQGGLRANRTSGHSFLIRQILDEKTSEDAVRSLAKELDALSEPIETLFLSCEMILSHHFWHKPGTGLREHVIDKLMTAFGGADIDIVLLSRPPLEWAEVYYKEIISNPYNHYSDSFLEFARLLSDRGLLDLEAVVRFLESRPGINNVVVAPYSNISVSHGSVPFILQQLRIDPRKQAWQTDTKVNSSLPDSSVWLIRQAKILGDRHGGLDKLFREVLSSETIQEDNPPLVSDEERTQVAAFLGTSQVTASPGPTPLRNPGSSRLLGPFRHPAATSRRGIKQVFSRSLTVLQYLPRKLKGSECLRKLKTPAFLFTKKAFYFISAMFYRGGKLALLQVRRGKWSFWAE